MAQQILEKVDETLDTYANQLSSSSLTFQSIVREDPWGEIAQYARGEGLRQLANLLENAEYATC